MKETTISGLLPKRKVEQYLEQMGFGFHSKFYVTNSYPYGRLCPVRHPRMDQRAGRSGLIKKVLNWGGRTAQTLAGGWEGKREKNRSRSCTIPLFMGASECWGDFRGAACFSTRCGAVIMGISMESRQNMRSMETGRESIPAQGLLRSG